MKNRSRSRKSSYPFSTTYIGCGLVLATFLLSIKPLWGQVSSRRTPVVQAVGKAAPAVVNIYIEEKIATPVNPFFGRRDNLFENFFNQVIPRRNSKHQSLGSGVLIDPNGVIVTNAHVIQKATAIKITLSDNRQFPANILGADVKSDLAILKIDSDTPLPYLKMGRSDDLMIGETALAIGNPFGLQHTVTQGIISALHRTISDRKDRAFHDFVQVDASINPGNSGGPLLNINGSLIGINAAIYKRAEGIGFAIPIDHVKRIVNELIQFGKVRRGWIGISVQNISPSIIRHFGLNRPIGVLVVRVFEAGPAKRAGLRRADIILSIDQHELKSKIDYQQTISSYTLEDSLTLEILRDGKQKQIKLRVASISRREAESFAQQWLGIQVQEMRSNLQDRYGLIAREGVVVVKTNPNGAAGKIGIRPGDVIRKINQVRIATLDDFNRTIVAAGGSSSVLLLVQRGRNGYYVTLEP